MSELSFRLLKALGSPLSLAKITKTCRSQAMSAPGDLSAAAQHLPDIEWWRCQSVLAGFLSLIPSPFQSNAKREKRWLCDAPRFAGRKSGLWSASPRHSAMKIPRFSLLKDWCCTPNASRNCAHPSHCFAPKCNLLLLLEPRRHSVTRFPEQHCTRSCALCDDQMLESWMNFACHETRRDRSRKQARNAVSVHAADFETKLETSRGGSLATVNPLCTRLAYQYWLDTSCTAAAAVHNWAICKHACREVRRSNVGLRSAPWLVQELDSCVEDGFPSSFKFGSRNHVEHSFRKARQLWTLDKLLSPCNFFEKSRRHQHSDLRGGRSGRIDFLA